MICMGYILDACPEWNDGRFGVGINLELIPFWMVGWLNESWVGAWFQAGMPLSNRKSRCDRTGMRCICMLHIGNMIKTHDTV